MVINFLKNKYAVPAALSLIILYASCEVDYAGLFRSEDLDNRLDSAYSFPYLGSHRYDLSDTSSTDYPSSWLELYIDSPSYSFLFITDVHITEDDTNHLEDLQNKFIESDKFVVVGGDITQSGSRRELVSFINITTAWRRVDENGKTSIAMPCYPVLGNHDIYFNNWELWKGLIGSSRYRIDSSGMEGSASETTLIILDTANAYFGNAQLDWLARQLNSSKRNTFVFAHGTLFVDGNPAQNKKTIPAHERARVISLISKSPARAYLSGHIHARNEQEVQGRKYFSLEDFKSYRAFLRVTVNSDGTITYSFGSL
jgi:3',5'-cyclic AMP phosphodiesterase CpdA